MITAENLFIFTAAFFDDAAPIRWLAESAQAHGVRLMAIGVGRRVGSNLDAKIGLIDELIRRREQGYEYGMFIDGSDSLLCAGIDGILRAYHPFAGKLVVSAERNCWPDSASALRQPAPPPPARARFLCSGGYIGPLDIVVETLERIRDWRVRWCAEHPAADSAFCYEATSDQYWMVQLHVNGEVPMTLDYRSELFFSVNRAFFDLAIDWQRPAVVVKPFGRQPCVLHFNGPMAKRLLSHFHRMLIASELPTFRQRLAMNLIGAATNRVGNRAVSRLQRLRARIVGVPQRLG